MAIIFLTCDFGIEHYLNPANRNKVLGTTLHPIVDSVAQNLSTTGHPQALNQRTTARESFISPHFSPKGMDDGMISHLPHHLLNRPNIRRGTACTHSMCQHVTFILSFT